MISSRIHRIVSCTRYRRAIPDQRDSRLSGKVKFGRAHAILFRKQGRQFCLSFGKNADAKLAGIFERLEAADAVVQAHQDQRWVQ